MKRYFTAICLMAALAAGFSAQAKDRKSTDMQPDTYAYTRGVEAYDDNKFDEATEWFTKELKDHPDNGYAYLYLGSIYGNNDENGRAISALDKARKLIPKKDKEWRAIECAYRADILLAMEDTIRALSEQTEAIKLDPENTKLLQNRADLYFEQKKYDLADADYRQMTILDPGNVMGYMGIGRNAKEQKCWDDAIAQFDYVIKLAPEYSSGYSFRAEANMGKEKWNEAADDIIKALDIDRDDKAYYHLCSFPAEQSNMLKTKLKIQMAKQSQNPYWPYAIASVEKNVDNNPREAISWYEKANNLDANPILLKSIAGCYYEMHDNLAALEAIDKALAMNPEDTRALDSKADILIRLNRLDDAVAEQSKIISDYPDHILGYIGRAGTLMDADRLDEALEDYNIIFTLLPSLSDVNYLLTHRADAYRLLGRTSEAEADYRHMIEIEKDSTLSSKSWIAFAYSGLGDHEKAIETMQTILANDTTDRDGNLYNLACIYSRAGKKAEAIGTLRKLMDSGYDSPEQILNDYDLNPLREEPEVIAICEEIRKKYVSGAGNDDGEGEFITETVEVPFTKDGGVTKVKCTINDLPLHFVFDTGAADVTMSMTEANFMLKNDYIKPSDIIGSARYMDANGDITEGTVINLRKVDFGGLELDNVRASVIRNQKAPLLLGQSVLGRLGSIEIDNPGMKLKITKRRRIDR